MRRWLLAALLIFGAHAQAAQELPILSYPNSYSIKDTCANALTDHKNPKRPKKCTYEWGDARANLVIEHVKDVSPTVSTYKINFIQNIEYYEDQAVFIEQMENPNNEQIINSKTFAASEFYVDTQKLTLFTFRDSYCGKPAINAQHRFTDHGFIFVYVAHKKDSLINKHTSSCKDA